MLKFVVNDCVKNIRLSQARNYVILRKVHVRIDIILNFCVLKTYIFSYFEAFYSVLQTLLNYKKHGNQ